MSTMQLAVVRLCVSWFENDVDVSPSLKFPVYRKGWR